MIVTRALYGLKSSGAAFRAFLVEHLHDMGFCLSLADLDAWMRPAIGNNGFKYWEYFLCYVDDILAISQDPTKIMKNIQGKFKLKDNKMEEPDTYLGADITKIQNEEGDLCYVVSIDKYCGVLVENIQSTLSRKQKNYQRDVQCHCQLDTSQNLVSLEN